MELTNRCKDYWKLTRTKRPFSTHVEEAGGLFLWPAFDALVGRIVEAVTCRQFLVVAGAACSAKSVAWREARRRVRDAGGLAWVAEPQGLDPHRYRETTLYHAIKYGIEPPDGSPQRRLARSYEDRARQCRRLLEDCNDRGTTVVLAVNDAHACSRRFLLACKRLWDDLYGFDRLLAVVLIGQPPLLRAVGGIAEIDQRAEVATLPGLGKHTAAYVQHEWARCCAKGPRPAPLDEGAFEELGRLAGRNPLTSRDHPLAVNNVVSLALHEAWRIKAQTIDRDLMAEAVRACRAG